MYQLILVFTKNSVNGACIHSQIVGFYASKDKAEEAANGMEFRNREFNAATIILPAPDYSSLNQNLNY